MRRVAFVIAVVMLLTIAAPAFSQPEHSRMDLIRRVELLQAEINEILGILQADMAVSAASTSTSLTDILDGLKKAIGDVDALVIQARKFLETGETQMGQLGDSVNLEMQKISGGVVVSLRQMNAEVGKLGGLVEDEMTGISGEIEILIKNLQLLVKTATETTSHIGDQVGEELDSISTEIAQSLARISFGIDALIRKLGDRIDVELKEISNEIRSELVKLNDEIQELIATTSAFVEESRLTLRDIRVATEKTVGFISRIDGRIITNVYINEDGLDSKADIMLWLEDKDDRPFQFMRIGAVDLDTDPEVEIIGGSANPPFSIGLGYIRQGVGIRLGYHEVIRGGFDVMVQAYRFDAPLVDGELGYTFASGLRPFVYADDLFDRDDMAAGCGMGFVLNF